MTNKIKRNQKEKDEIFDVMAQLIYYQKQVRLLEGKLEEYTSKLICNVGAPC